MGDDYRDIDYVPDHEREGFVPPGWQPIETAPKDGTPIDGWLSTVYPCGCVGKGQRFVNIEWTKYETGMLYESLEFSDARKYDLLVDNHLWVWRQFEKDEFLAPKAVEWRCLHHKMVLTHWMPLPAPPEGDEE